ncbi:MAG: outer membrane protein assembly factor BamD [Verrucomicrobiaceae bacterium]|nr:outer membrane protein assembly factor BamD [Verrucomicrobiaceae bacterium]
MKITAFPRLAAPAILLSVVITTPASAFLGGLFKKPQKKVPAPAELNSQEAEASAQLQEARARGDKGALRSIAERYPFTKAAAEAAYEYASLLRQSGKLEDAFDAFQKFITDYRTSPRFDEAVQQQYEIAEEARGGKKQRSFVIVPMKLGTEATVKMYRQIIANAPYGRFASMAQFSMGEVYQDKGDKSAAVAAYQLVVDNYPASKEASEAQFRIGAISNVAAKRTQDGENLNETRDALNSYMATNPQGERASEALALLSQVDENEAGRSLEIGKFYERIGKPKAAAIYYNEALRFGSAESSQEARERLEVISAEFPEAIAETKVDPSTNFTRPGAMDLRGRDDYAGPPSPDLAKLSEKPKMRQEGFAPIPMQEPALPVRAGGTEAGPANSLLPPPPGAPPAPGKTGESSLLLPVPSTPATPAPPPPPPPPAEAEKKRN